MKWLDEIDEMTRFGDEMKGLELIVLNDPTFETLHLIFQFLPHLLSKIYLFPATTLNP